MLYIHTINPATRHQLAFSRRRTENIPVTRFTRARTNLALQKPPARRGVESATSVSFDLDFREKRSSVVRGYFLQGLQQSLFDFLPV